MIELPLVSVLMTCYNREKYIADSIQSVLVSSYGNFELIIVDDCSTDQTLEIARLFEKQDSRIKVFVNETNLGDYYNRNKAATYAKGKYIKYVDSDDLIYPHGLQVMVEAMEKFPDSAVGFPRSNQPYGPHPVQMRPERAFNEHFLVEPIFEYAPNSAIIRADIFFREGSFTDDSIILHCALGDFEMWLRLAFTYPIVFFTGEVVWGRVHGEQESFYKQKDHLVAATRYQLNHRYLLRARRYFTENEFEKALKRLQQNHSRYMLSLLVKRFDITAFRFLFKSSNIPVRRLLSGLKGYDS